MPQQEIEVILARHLAEHLAMPIFIVNPLGDLLFYNEPAEDILGYNFDDTGPMPANQWASMFQPYNQQGHLLAPEELPLVIAVNERHPEHSIFWIKGLDGAMRQIAVTAFPLIGQADRFVGALAIFWEVGK